MNYVERTFLEKVSSIVSYIATLVTNSTSLVTNSTTRRVSKVLTQVLWAAAANKSIAFGAAATSDAATFDAASFTGTMQLKAKNNGTPASGDKVEVYLLYTNGDPDADPDNLDEYDTTTQGTLLAVLDTFITDPAISTVSINVAAKGCKIYTLSKASSNGITVSAQMCEARG